jgi:hypothetical protein
MTEPENQKNSAKIFEKLKEITFEFIEKGGELNPTVFFVSDSSTEIVRTSLVGVPKEFWQPFVLSMVKKLNPDAYIFVTELEMTAQPLNDPNAPIVKDDDLLMFFAYFKDGTEKSDYMYISKDRKLLRDKRTLKESEDLRIGNVFPALQPQGTGG